MLVAWLIVSAAYVAPLTRSSVGVPGVSRRHGIVSMVEAEAPESMAAEAGAPELMIDLPALKAKFRLQAYRCERGFSATSTTRKQLQDLAVELEAVGAQSLSPIAPTASPLLLGKWYLDFCDAGDVLSLSLLPLPLGGRIGPIYQDVAAAEEPGKFTVQNGVTFVPPGALSAIVDVSGLSTVYEVEARCAVLDDTRVSLAFIGARTRVSALPALGGALPPSVADQIIEGVQGIIGERVFLETTYLDETMRIARGPQRELYVLSKRE